ncbi:MAG: hypothetical protein DRQ13_07865 [Ignavibacteriae bacterium]|nr:MAG: hypothetical protein DRQ13_07865 [Ignavibacteriota bacterium]
MYPRWLIGNGYHTEQTSGITYIGSNMENEKFFLLADDVGKIHRMKITNDTSFSFTSICFSEEVLWYFNDFPKLDFEEITYDKYTGDVYLSIEGNEENYNDFVGIYKIFFINNDPFDSSIVNIEKLNIQPEAEFYKYTQWNIGYEGLAVDSSYLYLGLEGFVNDKEFADSTIILVVDKNNLTIIREISTKEFGIHTIGGLYADNNFNLWGIDRNNRRLFILELNENIKVDDTNSWILKPTIPGYPEINYVGSMESITFDNDGNIYLVDDPWRKFFIPPEDVLGKLDSQTISNFAGYIPVIFRYKLK